MARWVASLLFATHSFAARVSDDFDGLSILATSHNAAGKKDYDKGTYDTMFGRMLDKMHREKMSFDLSIFGLQEMKDIDGFVKAATSIYPKGEGCKAVKHSTRTLCPTVFGELGLVVCTKPDSEWSMSVVQDIDLSHERKLLECSKGTTGAVIQAKKGSQTVRICAVTTHMSYSAKASDRMNDWATVMAKLETLKCDVSLFMGDFNSRLHCAIPEAKVKKSDGPLLSSNLAKYSQFAYVLGEVCDGIGCLYDKGSARLYDEMTGFLNEKTVSCFEGEELKSFPNTILKYGFHEHMNSPKFGPTYKLKANSFADKLTSEELGEQINTEIARKILSMKVLEPSEHAWEYCLDSAGQDCLFNEKKKGKNNPAWTDRVLLRLGKNVEEVPDLGWYRRIVMPETDHASVQSALLFTFKS